MWVDDRGYLWTSRSRPEGAKGTLFDVFDPDGRYLGEVSAPLSLQTVLIRGTALYATATDEDDAPVIVRFRIQRR
jgi:sugar lactone lactonase YvrE